MLISLDFWIFSSPSNTAVGIAIGFSNLLGTPSSSFTYPKGGLGEPQDQGMMSKEIAASTNAGGDAHACSGDEQG
ncbi:MAG: hypothetical protein LC740_15230, partial [Actinobacteria bacterium]|nr:hypothetical protein [Actinomycetota bacterium]